MFPQSYWNGMFTSPKNLRSPGPSVFWLPHQAFKDALSSGDSSCSHEGKPGSDPWHQRCSVENEQQIHWDKIMGKLCEMCFQLGVLPFQISDKPFHQNILIQIEYLSWPPHLAILLGFKHCSGFSMFQHQIRVKAGTQVIMYIKYIIYILQYMLSIWYYNHIYCKVPCICVSPFHFRNPPARGRPVAHSLRSLRSLGTSSKRRFPTSKIHRPTVSPSMMISVQVDSTKFHDVPDAWDKVSQQPIAAHDNCHILSSEFIYIFPAPQLIHVRR